MRYIIVALAAVAVAAAVAGPGGCRAGDRGTGPGETKVFDPKCPRCPGGVARPRFGGGGGPVPGWLFADLGVINDEVAKMGISDLSESIFMMGGKGYARFGNVIIGGGGYAGTTSTSGSPDLAARHVTVDLGYGGAIVGADLAYSRYELTAGVLVGGGSVTVTREIATRGVFDWNDSWRHFRTDLPDSVSTGDLTMSSRLTADFLALEPFVELKVRIRSFLALGVAGSYLRAHVGQGNWKMDGLDIPDSPEADLGGPSVKLSIIFGT